jgi:hypothetical protein
MGFLRKLTGAQGQIDAAKKNANATMAAAKLSADSQIAALNATTQAAAAAQAQAAERSRVEREAADAVSKPLEVADVSLAPAATGSAVGDARRKRAQFGRGYSATGVNL